MAVEKPRLLIVTAVWGEWHINALYEMNLPTLLAPGNFPSLAKYCDIHYLIFTSKADRAQIESAPVNAVLREFMTIEFRLLNDWDLADPIKAHHLAWEMAIKQATRDGQSILLMPPDVAWSENSFRNVGQRLSQGVEAIFMTYLRAEERSFSAAMAAEPRAEDGSLCVASQRLVELCINNLHPLMAAYLADSEYFPVHPEMMLWAVPGQGVLVRVLAREMFLFNPQKVSLNKVQLPEEPILPDDACFLSDSDELFAVSLAPIGKDAGWHIAPNRADPVDVGSWWAVYDSKINDFVVSHRLRWHFAPTTEAAWQAVERRSDLFLRRAAGTREGIRFWRVAHQLELPTCASLLAVAAQTGAMARALSGRYSAAALIPDENALSELGAELLNILQSPRGMRALSEIIRRHTIPLENHLMLEQDPLRAISLAQNADTMLIHGSGRYSLEQTKTGEITIDGSVVYLQQTELSQNHKVYIIDKLLIDKSEIESLLTPEAA